MRRRKREVQIFSLSLLDVLSGALGAFLIILVVLFPYYDLEAIELRAEIEALQAELERVAERASRAEARVEELEEVEAQLAETREQLEEAETRASAAEARLANIRFLIVSITWDTEAHDVDLHVTDPSGATFSWQSPTLPGRPGELTQDDVDGPGTEIWQLLQAQPGTYRVQAELFDRHGNPASARLTGRVFHRDGVYDIAPRTIAAERDLQTLVTVTVSPEGDVSFQ